MATYRAQMTLQGATGLSEDRFVNVLYFDIDGGPTQAISDEIADAFDQTVSAIVGGLANSGHEIRWYSTAGGQPVAIHDISFDTTFPADSGPSEVAICLSYAAVDDPEQSTARRRGRIYIGPLRTSVTGNPRPTASHRDSVLDYGERLAQVGFANAVTWQMWSPTDGVAAKIESIWCDDAFDTQRRRGLAPTTRETRDVQ